MQPLEHRRWFIVATFVLSMAAMLVLWRAASLPIALHTCGVYLFSVAGLWTGLNKLVAIIVIRVVPSLGAIGSSTS